MIRDDIIRDAILRAMEDDELNPTQIAREIAGNRPPSSAVRGFLAGTNRLSSERLSPILRLLRLEVVRSARKGA